MRRIKPAVIFLCSLLVISSRLNADDNDLILVTPDASVEAKALLKLMYGISGKFMLSGQHNYPNTRDVNSQFAARYTGKSPVVWSTDWGFAKEGDKDSYLARPAIVKEAIRQHRMGSLVTICWHAVPPTGDEPTTFRPLPGVEYDSLQTVQGRLSERQFRDILTPGTVLYNRWCAQVDTIAGYLRKLEDAGVPVLWRPYHEMNGDWFWWGGHTGDYSTINLYKQLFDRLVNFHNLKNLVWLWSVDKANNPDRYYSYYFPGSEYFDVVSLDVYGRDFNQVYYDSLEIYSDGKPMVLGEVGNPPTLDIIDNQPKWGFYVTWAGMVRNTSLKEYEALDSDPRVLSREDDAYREIVAVFRSACNLPELESSENQKIDISGTWLFNEEKSILENRGAANIPVKLTISHSNDLLVIEKTILVEYLEPEIRTDTVYLNGTEVHSELWNAPMVTTAGHSEKGDSIIVESKVTFTHGDGTSERVTNQTYLLSSLSRILTIKQYSSSMWGERDITLVYEKLIID